MLLNTKEHLTETNTSDLVKGTHVGMAYFAGTGPKGKTCRECAHWGATVRKHLYRNPVYSAPDLQHHECNKFTKMIGRAGGKVPHEAAACKYFKQSENPPAIRKRYE